MSTNDQDLRQSSAPAAVGVPEGFVLVPEWPTDEMCAAAKAENDKWPFGAGHMSIYRAMLAAAPSAGNALPADSECILIDWPMCNPACDPELDGMRSQHCTCEAAKASIARQREAAQPAAPDSAAAPAAMTWPKTAAEGMRQWDALPDATLANNQWAANLCDKKAMADAVDAAQPPAQDGDVPMPDWVFRDDLGNLVPSEIRQSVRAYGNARALAALASAGKPAAYIEHHKGGDNLVWTVEKHMSSVTPLYTGTGKPSGQDAIDRKPCEKWCGQVCMDKGECKHDLPEVVCPSCGSEEWDRITNRVAPGEAFNRCNQCGNEWVEEGEQA